MFVHFKWSVFSGKSCSMFFSSSFFSLASGGHTMAQKLISFVRIIILPFITPCWVTQFLDIPILLGGWV